MKKGKIRTNLMILISVLVLLCITVVFSYIYAFESHHVTLTEYIRRLEDSGNSKNEVIVAVIDSGCNMLENYGDRLMAGYNFVEDSKATDDILNHGTRIAELILSNTPENVKVMPLKTTDENGAAYVSHVCRAITYAVENGADLINLSLNAVINGASENEQLGELIKELSEKGISVIVSAGNMGENVNNLVPASIKEAIVVAAVDENQIPYFFSGYGEYVDVCSRGKYGNETGTSYSAAYVTSVAAILRMYHVENIDETLKLYAGDYYDKDKEAYGKGYVWIDSFADRSENTYRGKNTNQFVAFSSSSENDLGLNLIHIDWREMSSGELEQYFLETAKEYVGMFLKSLSEEEMRMLAAKCSIIHSEVEVTDCGWNVKSDSFEVNSNRTMDFAQYCIEQYEGSMGKMTLSGSWCAENTMFVFYIANEDRSIKYRYEVRGNIYGKEAVQGDHNLLGGDGSLELAAFGLNYPSFKKPQLSSDGFQNYVSGITSRWVAYFGPEVEQGRVGAKEYHEEYSLSNNSDNGLIHYGLSIPLTGISMNSRKGYHYDTSGIKGYQYNTDYYALSHRYTELLPTGFVYSETPTHRIPIHTGYNKLSGILNAVSYNAKEEASYQICPDPTVISISDAEAYYDIKHFQVYLQMSESSLDTEKGNMTLNSGIYELSGLTFYDEIVNKKVISNDIIEYVMGQVPDYYNIVLHANEGNITKFGTSETVNTTTFTAYYDSTDNSNISEIFPNRENYIFTGWYTDIIGGEKVWDSNGIAQNGTYWENGIWKYSQQWSEDNNTLVFYAHWEPAGYEIHFNANGGIGSRPAMVNLSYDRIYTLSANHWPDNGFEREGYYFCGWNTAADGSGIGYSDTAGFSKRNDGGGNIVVLYAQWEFVDVIPPEIMPEPPEDLEIESGVDRYIYGWTNKEILLKFSASDDMEMDSLILYEGEGIWGNVLETGINHIEYTASKEGIFHYTLAARDKTGNTSTLYITTKIDYATPKGEMEVLYDGSCLKVSLHDIVEENQQYPDNAASGCQNAWILLQGVNAQGTVICQEEKELSLITSDNIYTGAVYEGSFDLSDEYNYTSEYLHITAYIMDYAGNYLPFMAYKTIPAFVLNAELERCLGKAAYWKAGEAGIIHIYSASWVDCVKVDYPESWIALDHTLDGRSFDYILTGKANEKREEELFYVPLRLKDGQYTITVTAYKNGRQKSVVLPLHSSGTILDELRTRLR